MKTSRKETSIPKSKLNSDLPYQISMRYTNRNFATMSTVNENAESSNPGAESANNVENANRQINNPQETVAYISNFPVFGTTTPPRGLT